MNIDRLKHTDHDPWHWQTVVSADVPEMVTLTDQNYLLPGEDIIVRRNPTKLHYELHRGILAQHYESNQLITVARNNVTQKIQAWTWLVRGQYTVYSDEEIAQAAFCHADLTLPVRTRIRLVAQMIQQWIFWCELKQIPVLASTSIRSRQAGFMRLHESFGFEVRGDSAYRRIL